jgi:methionine salvage enolase-phosphatase E1
MMSKLPKKNAYKSNLFADICNKLRRTAAIAGLLFIYNKGQMPQRAIFQCMDESFHGSVEKVFVAQIDKFIGGLSPFDNNLFNKVTDV